MPVRTVPAINGNLQQNAAANGTGSVMAIAGSVKTSRIEIVKSGTGTCTVTFEGCEDTTIGSPAWYPIRYQKLADGKTDGTTGTGVASPVNAVGDIALATGTILSSYNLLDSYENVRCRLSAVVGAVSVSANWRGIA